MIAVLSLWLVGLVPAPAQAQSLSVAGAAVWDNTGARAAQVSIGLFTDTVHGSCLSTDVSSATGIYNLIWASFVGSPDLYVMLAEPHDGQQAEPVRLSVNQAAGPTAFSRPKDLQIVSLPQLAKPVAASEEPIPVEAALRYAEAMSADLSARARLGLIELKEADHRAAAQLAPLVQALAADRRSEFASALSEHVSAKADPQDRPLGSFSREGLFALLDASREPGPDRNDFKVATSGGEPIRVLYPMRLAHAFDQIAAQVKEQGQAVVLATGTEGLPRRDQLSNVDIVVLDRPLDGTTTEDWLRSLRGNVLKLDVATSPAMRGEAIYMLVREQSSNSAAAGAFARQWYLPEGRSILLKANLEPVPADARANALEQINKELGPKR